MFQQGRSDSYRVDPDSRKPPGSSGILELLPLLAMDVSVEVLIAVVGCKFPLGILYSLLHVCRVFNLFACPRVLLGASVFVRLISFPFPLPFVPLFCFASAPAFQSRVVSISWQDVGARFLLQTFELRTAGAKTTRVLLQNHIKPHLFFSKTT